MPERIRPRRIVVAVSLSATDVAETDRIAKALDERNWPGANRSLVIRMAIGYFSATLRGKSPDQIVDFLIENRAARVGTAAASPTDGGDVKA